MLHACMHACNSVRDRLEPAPTFHAGLANVHIRIHITSPVVYPCTPQPAAIRIVGRAEQSPGEGR